MTWCIGGIANQPSPAYSFLYLSNFLSFNTLNDEIFVKDFCKTVQARVVIFSKQVDDDMMYRWIANQPSPAYFSLHLSDFLSFHTLNDEIFRHRFLLNCASLSLSEPSHIFPVFVRFSFFPYIE